LKLVVHTIVHYAMKHFFYIVTDIIYKGQKFYLKSQKYGEFKM